MFRKKDTKRECPSCALDSSELEEICPYCGYEFPPPQKGMSVMVWIFLLLMLFWLVMRSL